MAKKVKPDVKIAQHRECVIQGVRYLKLNSKSELDAAENPVKNEAESVGKSFKFWKTWITGCKIETSYDGSGSIWSALNLDFLCNSCLRSW